MVGDEAQRTWLGSVTLYPERWVIGVSSSLVFILWPASVFFTAVLCFRVGVWWKGIHAHGRHEFVPRRTGSRSRHGDGVAAYGEGDGYLGDWGDDEADRGTEGDEDGFPGDDAAQLPRRLASAPEGWREDATARMERPPASSKPVRWWSDDDDTAVLPRLQDVRPPMRATPIRRPPWVGRDRGK